LPLSSQQTTSPASGPAEEEAASLDAKRPFIHVGYPKCASTYLQRTVFPALGNLTDLTQAPQEEKWQLLGDEADPAAFRRSVERYTAHREPAADHRLISYEGLVRVPFPAFSELFWQARQSQGWDVTPYTRQSPPIVERLAEAYPDARIMIIVREQFSWAISQYKMYWRRGHTTQSIDELLGRYVEGYDEQVERFMQAFGKDRVLVLPYELLREDAEQFVRSITQFIDPAFEPRITNSRVNAAPSLLRQVHYRRAKSRLKARLKKGGGQAGLARRAAFTAAWMWTASVGRGWYSLRYGGQKDTVELPEATRARLRPRLAASNRRLAALTGLDLERYGYCLEPEPSAGSA
jgi:hypothetical protein